MTLTRLGWLSFIGILMSSLCVMPVPGQDDVGTGDGGGTIGTGDDTGTGDGDGGGHEEEEADTCSLDLILWTATAANWDAEGGAGTLEVSLENKASGSRPLNRYKAKYHVKVVKDGVVYSVVDDFGTGGEDEFAGPATEIENSSSTAIKANIQAAFKAKYKNVFTTDPELNEFTASFLARLQGFKAGATPNPLEAGNKGGVELEPVDGADSENTDEDFPAQPDEFQGF